MNCESMHPGGLRLTDRAARLAGVSSGMSIADIGCGSGAALRYLKSKYDITAAGCDISEEYIADAAASVPGAEFICCDAAYLQCEKAGADIVFCECALSGMNEPEQVLKNILGLLRTGGRLVISDIYAKTVSDALWTKQKLYNMLTESGFDILIEEDHTPALVTYAAEHYGSGCASLGYTLVIAGKNI